MYMCSVNELVIVRNARLYVFFISKLFPKHATCSSGFTLSSLRLLTDVRNSLRSDRNLLHYVVEHIESKQPDVLRLKRDLESVYQAARHR